MMRGWRSSKLRRITDLMRAAIVAGTMPRVLPSEQELQVIYGASRNVIRDALDELRVEGFLDRQQGTGTFIVGRRFRHRIDSAGGFNTGGTEVVLRREPISFEIVPAVPIVLVMLGLSEGSMAIMVERVTTVDGEPISYWTSYLPPELEEVIHRLGPTDSLHAVIGAVAGHEVGDVHFTHSAGLATAPVAEILQMPVSSPVTRHERLAMLTGGGVCEFAVGWARGDKFSYQSMRRG